jgi:DNA anti-recombination protein RmuC
MHQILYIIKEVENFWKQKLQRLNHKEIIFEQSIVYRRIGSVI